MDANNLPHSFKNKLHVLDLFVKDNAFVFGSTGYRKKKEKKRETIIRFDCRPLKGGNKATSKETAEASGNLLWLSLLGKSQS